MSRRIEIELTSKREDGSWTWRAAGARQPKGDLDGALIPDGVDVGATVSADADFAIDGIEILSIKPPKAARKGPERIEILGSGKEEPLVTGPPERAGRGDRKGGKRGGGRDRDGGRGRDDTRGRGREDGRGGGRGRDDRGGDRGRDNRSGGGDREGRRREAPSKDATPKKPKAPRLRPKRIHRDAVIESLPAEHRPIAEQVLSGGIPAVRAAIAKQNEEAKAAGHPEVSPDALVRLAENDLLPQLRTAEWADRADAAIAMAETVDLRDLRSVVATADAGARTEETRAQATQLRAALDARVAAEQEQWLAEVTAAVTEGRVVRALRVSSRPPKAGSRLPNELADKLASQAGEALGADVTQDRWGAVLDAVAHSPVRLKVAPAAIPAEPTAELLSAVKRVADRVPAIAAALGVEPAAKAAPKRRGGSGKGPARSGLKPPPGSAPRIPPPPSAPPKALPATPAATAASNDEEATAPATDRPATTPADSVPNPATDGPPAAPTEVTSEASETPPATEA